MTVNVVNKPVLDSVTVLPISDCNKSDASIQISAVGVNNIEYGLDDGSGSITWQTGDTFADLMAGTYLVYVRNADGSCPAAYNNNPIVINSPIAPAITNVASTPPNNCNNDGTITITATGGMPPLQYSIGGASQASNVFNGLGAGSYNIVVTNVDGSCGTADGPIVFTQPTPPTIVTPIANQNICVGSSVNISVQLSTTINTYAITGTGVHSGEVVNGNTLTFVASANAVGGSTYNVVLSEANGCSASSSFTLTGVAAPVATFTVSPVICTNGDVVLHNSSTNPNAWLTWSLAGGQVVSASTQNSTSPDSSTMVVKWATAGTKSITLSVNNGGCIVTSSQTITVADFNPGATLAVTDATCGLANGAIDISVSGTGYTYSWSNGNTSDDIGGISAGAYTVTITEPTSQCKSTASATIGGSPAIDISNVQIVPATQCAGANGDGSVTVSVSGGTGPFTYSLSGITPVSSPLASITFSNLPALSYTLTVSDSKGCTDVQTVVVTSVSSQLSVAVTTVDAGCTTDDGSVSATVTGGSGAYTYSLYENNIPSGSNIPVTGSTVALNGLAPGSYLIIFEDVNGCISAGSGTVLRKAGTFPATSTLTDAACGSSNGAIQLSNIPNGASFDWSVGGNANPLTNLVAGVYSATITESNGCMSSSTFVVNTTGGQDVTIDSITGSTCNLANGSITFTVTGGGQFSYKVLGSNLPSGFGTPDNSTLINNVPKGAYVLEITDLLQPSCQVYEVVVVSGSDAFQTNSTVKLATGCGNHNGEICIEISGGQMPYTVVASDGVIEPGNTPNKFCIKGLYEGLVEVTVTGAGGCQKIFTQDMGQFDEPNITVDSVQIIDPTCPGDSGSILSLSGSSYDIFNASNSYMGFTPWTAAMAGTYKLVLSQNGCVDSLSVTVTGPADWAIVPTIVAESCNTLGAVSLDITGGTAPISVLWSNGDTTAAITGLNAGTYSATITDANGCETISTNVVATDCLNPCEGEDLFYLDVYSQQLTAALTEICLPTYETNLSSYNLTLNSEPYERSIGDCGSVTNFYDGFDVLPVLGPYSLVEWTYGSDKELNYQFFDLEGLVSRMNEKDVAGNWVIDGGTIFGGDQAKVYGNMKVRHVASGFSLDLPPSKLTVPHPTILLDNHSQVQVLISESPDGCMDTLYINLLQPDPPTTDTIQVEVAEGATQTVCIPYGELYGTLEFLSNECISFTNNAQINSTTDNCVEVVGLDQGIDEACIVICDDLGVCDTTILLINVIDGGTELEVFTGFSPNGDGVNDVFKIKNIDLYPNNDLKIFNRWGKQVYNVKSYHNSWDAEYRSAKLPDGSYFYILNVEVDGVMKELKGFVEVRR